VTLLTPGSLDIIRAECFLSEARRGHLWVPSDVCAVADELAAVVRMVDAEVMVATPQLTVHVNTDNGLHTVWRLAEALQAFSGPTVAQIGGVAKSAGLIIACACERRVCQPNSVFLYHGSPYKAGIPDDRAKAQWFAKRTTQSEDFWFDLAAGGDDFEFGAEKALELGVVHEIAGYQVVGVKQNTTATGLGD